MKRQIVASSKRAFVKAATTDQMLDAFESKLSDMKSNDIESDTNVEASAQLQLFDDDGYAMYEDTNGQYTGVPGSNVSLAELKNYWNDFYDTDPVLNEEYDPDQGEKWLADMLSYMTPIENCDSIEMSVDELDEELDPVKGEQQWGDDQVFVLIDYTPGGPEDGMDADSFDPIGKFFATDIEDAKHQLEEAKKTEADRMQFLSDPYVQEYNEYFDDGSEVYPNLETLIKNSWIAPNDYDGNVYDDEPFASTQAEGDAVEAALIVDDEEVADTIEDVECVPVNDPIDASLIVNEEDVADTIEDVDCIPVNDPINAALVIDGEKVADTIEDIECSDELQDAEACGDVPVEGGLFDDYFGKEQADKYGDLIAENLSGQTVSKRKDLAEQSGGLIYEANLLGIDMWDLLEALEGMCYQGRAIEIDDSTYKVK